MNTKCFECDQPAHHDHHVVPKVLGGTKTLPLCEACHGKVHGCNWKDHGTLVRTGLQRARAQGKVLGNPNRKSFQAARQKAAQTIVDQADAFAMSTLPIIQTYQRQGLSLRAMAEEMNREGMPTARGGRWTATQLWNIQQRAVR